jgi:hypothetical protein
MHPKWLAPKKKKRKRKKRAINHIWFPRSDVPKGRI